MTEVIHNILLITVSTILVSVNISVTFFFFLTENRKIKFVRLLNLLGLF